MPESPRHGLVLSGQRASISLGHRDLMESNSLVGFLGRHLCWGSLASWLSELKPGFCLHFFTVAFELGFQSLAGS